MKAQGSDSRHCTPNHKYRQPSADPATSVFWI